MVEGSDGGRVQLVSHVCPECAVMRLFRVTARDGRRRMVCPVCGTDLPALVGPVGDWRELLEGPHADEPPDDGRRPL